MCRFLYFGQGENIDHIIPMLCRTKMLVKAYKLSHTISPNGLNGRYFSFTGNAPWQFHELSERDTDFSSTLLHKQGQELRSEQTVINIHEQNPSTYFCVLTIRKHLLNLSGRGPSICYRRPFCRLKAPLGLSLLRKRGLSEKYRTARIYSPWRFLPPRNTPDLFCRLLHPTKSSLRCVGGIFLFHK